MPAAALALLLVLAFVPAPSRAAYMLPGSPVRPKDFALVKRDGVFHLFYILNSAAQFPDNTENSFGHAVSSDLYHWSQRPPVLQVSPTTWDNLHVWAPTVVEQDGLWWMLYTGVTVDATHSRTQRIGLAVSSDLDTWTRVETPVWDATDVPWAWSNPTSPSPAFRDPYVMPDPAAPGGWLMYYTASYAPDTDATVVGVARSAGDLHTWTDAGPLLETWRGNTFNALTESPHMIQYHGLWYLFITTGSSQALTVFTSADPTGPVSAWTNRGRLRSILGTDTGTWYASEGLRDGAHQLYAYVNADRVELREMQFGSSWMFSLLQPPYFHVMTLGWASNTVHEGDTTAFAVRVANPLSGTPMLRAFLVNAQGEETAVVPESLGFTLPAQLDDDTLSVPFVARRWPRVPATDTLTVTRIRLRAADSTAVSAVFTVRARPIVTPPDSSGEGGEGVVVDPLPHPERKVNFFFRTLHGSPLGPSAATLAIGLDAATPTRVDVYDVLGRRVRTLADRELPVGVTVVTWDGRDQSGFALQRGVYFARMVAGARVLTVRVLLLDR